MRLDGSTAERGPRDVDAPGEKREPGITLAGLADRDEVGERRDAGIVAPVLDVLRWPTVVRESAALR